MTQKKTNMVAIITMCFIFAMISFVTNMAAPFGNIWGNNYPWSKMMGNMMNFAAYVFMGIPAGKMLIKVGYKKTTLIALAVGLIGVIIQWISSRAFLGDTAVYVYLLGAFVCGFCVCMLNTVVNPMLNILGGGGNKGNQYIQIGGTLNSLTGTLTPLLVGVLIGTITKKTAMADVSPLLFIAMAVFAIAFLIIYFVEIPEPAADRKDVKYEHSALNFRHCVLGIIAIFFYVGIEIGIPAQLNFFLSDASSKGAGILINGALIGGAFAACYWFLMMIGRFLSTLISGKISTKVQLATVSAVAIALIVAALCIDKKVDAPKILYNPYKKTVGILVNNGMAKEAAEAYISDPAGKAATLNDYLTDIAGSFGAEAISECSDVNAITAKGYYMQPDGTVIYVKKIKKGVPVVEAVEAEGYYLDKDGNLLKTKVADGKAVIDSEFNGGLDEFVANNLKKSQEVPQIPVSTILLILCGLCTSIMWGAIFNLAVEGLGKYTEQASGLFMTMVVGGGLMPLLQEVIAKNAGYMNSYWLVIAMLAYLLFYALVGCKNVNKDIPVE